MCICMYVHACIYQCIHTGMICPCAHFSIYVGHLLPQSVFVSCHTHTHTCIYIYIYIYSEIWLLCKSFAFTKCVSCLLCILSHICVCNIYIHENKHIHTHTHTHIYIYQIWPLYMSFAFTNTCAYICVHTLTYILTCVKRHIHAGYFPGFTGCNDPQRSCRFRAAYARIRDIRTAGIRHARKSDTQWSNAQNDKPREGSSNEKLRYGTQPAVWGDR